MPLRERFAHGGGNGHTQIPWKKRRKRRKKQWNQT
jgi:hypothetical protein